MAFAEMPRVRGIVLASGSIMTPADQVLYETGGQLRLLGYPDAVVQRSMDFQRRVLDYQRNGRPSPGLEQDLRRATAEPWFPAADLPARLWPIEEYAWWRQVMDFDSRPYWRRVSVPVLAFSGGRDPKHDQAKGQERLRVLLAEGGNRRFTGHVFLRAEHGMIEWCVGPRIPPPCWPEGMPEILVGWIRAI